MIPNAKVKGAKLNAVGSKSGKNYIASIYLFPSWKVCGRGREENWDEAFYRPNNLNAVTSLPFLMYSFISIAKIIDTLCWIVSCKNI